MSRPKKIYTSEEIAQVEALAAYGHTQEEITNYLGVRPTSFRVARNENKILNEAYTRGRFEARSFVASRLMRYIKSDELSAVNLNAISLYLRTQAGWSEKQLVETKDTTPKQQPSLILHFNSKPINIEHQEVKGVTEEKMKIS